MREADNEAAYEVGEQAEGMPEHDAHEFRSEPTAEVDSDFELRLGPKYVPYSFRWIWRQPKYPMLVEGKLIASYWALEITEYVDTRTGEIVGPRGLPLEKMPPTNRYAEQCLQRHAVLSKLRPEVRKFALFVLQFRDRRGGMTPGMDKLVRWYADLEGKRVPDVRRYVERLEEAGVCEGDCMGPRFMWFEKLRPRSLYLGAAPMAEARFFLMKHRKGPWGPEAQHERDAKLTEQPVVDRGDPDEKAA
jgi:hypothetical protein